MARVLAAAGADRLSAMHPILFQMGPVTIYSYGTCVALAIGLSWWSLMKLAKAKGASPSVAADLLFAACVGGILGGRLFYVLQHWHEFSGRPWTVLALYEGGLVWYGGFLGAVTAARLEAFRRRLPALFWADLFFVIVPAAHALGRVGCFLNGCCHGRELAPGILHPVQLYEAFLLAFLAFALWRRIGRPHADGSVTAWYLVGYGTVRFGIEFFRADQPVWAGLTLPQWLSLALVVCGIGFLRRKKR